MQTDVTPSMAGYAKGLAVAARDRAYALALEADEAIERAEAGGWMDGPTGRALELTDAADAALGHAIDTGRWAWEADRMLAGQARPRPVQDVELSAAAAEAEAG